MKTKSDKTAHRANRKSKAIRGWRDIENDAQRLLAYIERAPDWITNLLVHALDDAGRLTSFPVPTWAPEEKPAEREKMVAELLGQVGLRFLDPTESKNRVKRALYELLHNPDTPNGLFDRCAEFLCDQSNQGQENVYHSDLVIEAVLKSVPGDELRAAVIAARNEESDGAQ